LRRLVDSFQEVRVMDPQIVAKAQLAWKWLQPQLPVRAPHLKGGRPWQDDYACVVGIVWVLVTGARWKDLPKEIGVGYVTCWRRHRDWTGQGLWQAAWAAALAEVERRRPQASGTSVVDGMFVRARKGATTWAKPRSAKA
jgi:transposase